MRKRFALVYNARAGVARPKLLDGILKILKSSGTEVFQLPTRSADEARERVGALAGSGSADAVIAAGGDGTFRAVAIGAAGTALPVGYIPLGTGNVLAYEIGLEKRAAAVAQTLLHGVALPVQGGLVNGVPFFLMVGAGFDASIVAGLNYRTKRALGRAAYTVPVLRTVARPVRNFDVAVDGVQYRASWVIATRASHYGGSFTLTRETQLGRDPMLAILVEGQSRSALLSAAMALGLGRLGSISDPIKGVRVVPARRLQIGIHDGAPVQVDGDDAGISPAEVVADGPTVQLIVPERYVAGLTNCHANHVHLEL